MGKKNQRGVSLIALIITIAIILIIATAVLFRGGIDRIPWAQGGAHKMDKSVIAEAVEVYNTDKLTDATTPVAWAYPDAKQTDLRFTLNGSTGSSATVVVNETLPQSVGSTAANSSMCVIGFTTSSTGTPASWYNIKSSDPATKTITLYSAQTTDSYIVVKRQEEVNPNSTSTLTASGNTNITLANAGDDRIQVGWDIAPLTGTTAGQWFKITTVTNKNTFVVDGNISASTTYRLRRPHSASVDYALIYFPQRLIATGTNSLGEKISADFVSLQPTYSYKDMWTIIDIQALVDGSYISRSSDKGMQVYNSDGSVVADLATLSDTDNKIYIRHAVNSDGGSGTSNIYYVKGVPSENNTVVY